MRFWNLFPPISTIDPFQAGVFQDKERNFMHPLLDAVSAEKRPEASRCLARLLEQDLPDFHDRLTETLRECADPDAGALRLGRFLEKSADPDREIGRMNADPRYVPLLITLFTQSNFLSDILHRHPEFGGWLLETADLTKARSREEMLEDLPPPEEGISGFEAGCRVLRRFRKREILRIGARDLVAHAPVVSVTEDLSNLADAALEAALAAARASLRPQYGAPYHTDEAGRDTETEFVILALGKLGGRELNFSSDIDLIFLYTDEGHTRGEDIRELTSEEYFKKAGELIIKALSEQTADGFLFRVDMRLRPHGRIGPLASTFDQAVEYYADYGRAWERQAMIKARPCAGDLKLGRAFIQRVRSFVYPRYFDDQTLEDIRSVKRQTESIIAKKGHSEREVKLGRGGIRDIEFTVQMLQLLNAGRWPELRTPNTLKAIDGLGRREPLSPFEADTLSRNYLFLRHIEHRLQIMDGQQLHVIPEAGPQREAFAKRLGYSSCDAFMNVYRERTAENRKILERFLATKGSGQLWIGDLLNPLSTGEAGLEKLSEMGFAEPEKAREELLTLAMGTKRRPFTRYVHQRFTEIAPFLLNALSFTSDPDGLLLRLGQILGRLHAPAMLYELLNLNPALCHFLITLVYNSEYLSSFLIREPDLLDTVSSVEALDAPTPREELEETLAALRRAVDSEAAPYRLRDGEMLRVALRELVRGIPVAKVGDELTRLAEVILEDALARARRKTAERYGAEEARFAILGLGKLGGWEMGYGSDLDLLFVFESGRKLKCGMAPAEYFAAIAASTINQLKQPAEYGMLYDVDARLRPDGNKGMLAISEEHLAGYFREEAQDWERLALMKVRAVAGDTAFARQVEEAARDIAFSVPLNRDTLENIESLRRKMAEQADPLDIKKQEGGISEIEYTVRLWQLEHVAALPQLKRGDVFGALDILDAHGLTDESESGILREAWAELRRILNRIRMMHGNQQSRLPEAPAQRAVLASRLGIEAELSEYTAAFREKVHRVYEETAARLLEKG
jgi:[glutamine synthetase] adenylyltransferase / [glutamine synthetase]-adenylyl-L-tyrosine phosphorylase